MLACFHGKCVRLKCHGGDHSRLSNLDVGLSGLF